jgi:hypothetical protein
MFVAVDFDGTIVVQDGRPYEDVTTPLRFLPGAKEGLLALRRAGHVLMLWSARSSRALLYDPSHDPLVRAGVRRIDPRQWRASLPINRARHQQMLDFVRRELPDVFAVLDGGAGEKPHCDLFIDDKAVRMGRGPGALDWAEVAELWGAPGPQRAIMRASK